MMGETEIRTRIIDALESSANPWVPRNKILELCARDGADETTTDKVVSGMITGGEVRWTSDARLGAEMLGLWKRNGSTEAA